MDDTEMRKRTKVCIPNQASIHNLKSLLTLNDYFPEEAIEEFILSFHPKFSHVRPFMLSMLGAWGEYWKEQGVSISCENMEAKSLTYLTRMGLFESLGLEPPRPIMEHESSGQFVPLRRIRNGDHLREFLADVIPLLHAPKHADAVIYCLSELIRNVLEHAGRVSAYACAQYYRGADTVSIGVADCGIGIHQSLQGMYQTRNHSDSILMAMRPGVSGATPNMYAGSDNAGAGLFFTKSIAHATGGYFSIYSGNSAYRLKRRRKNESSSMQVDPTRDRHDVFEGLPCWKGTVVAIDIGARNGSSFSAIMKMIRDAYSEHLKPKSPVVLNFT